MKTTDITQVGAQVHEEVVVQVTELQPAQARVTCLFCGVRQKVRLSCICVGCGARLDAAEDPRWAHRVDARQQKPR